MPLMQLAWPNRAMVLRSVDCRRFNEHRDHDGRLRLTIAPRQGRNGDIWSKVGGDHAVKGTFRLHFPMNQVDLPTRFSASVSFWTPLVSSR